METTLTPYEILTNETNIALKAERRSRLLICFLGKWEALKGNYGQTRLIRTYNMTQMLSGGTLIHKEQGALDKVQTLGILIF